MATGTSDAQTSQQNMLPNTLITYIEKDILCQISAFTINRG